MPNHCRDSLLGVTKNPRPNNGSTTRVVRIPTYYQVAGIPRIATTCAATAMRGAIRATGSRAKSDGTGLYLVRSFQNIRLKVNTACFLSLDLSAACSMTLAFPCACLSVCMHACMSATFRHLRAAAPAHLMCDEQKPLCMDRKTSFAWIMPRVAQLAGGTRPLLLRSVTRNLDFVVRQRQRHGSPQATAMRSGSPGRGCCVWWKSFIRKCTIVSLDARAHSEIRGKGRRKRGSTREGRGGSRERRGGVA